MRACIMLLLPVFLSSLLNAGTPLTSTDFFTQPWTTSAKLSPDGTKVASIVNEGGGQKLNLISAGSRASNTLVDIKEFTTKDAKIHNVAWIDNEYLAAQFSEMNRGVPDLLDTRQRYYIIVLKLTADNKAPEVYSIKTKGWLVDPLPNEKDIFLYAKSGIYSKIYKLEASRLNRYKAAFNKLARTDGGQFIAANEIASVKGFARHWFIDETGTAQAALHYIDGDMNLSILEQKGESKKLKTWPKKSLSYKNKLKDEEGASTKKLLLPVAYAGEENTFYCLDFFEDEERSVYKINFETDATELVYEASAFEIIDLITSPSDYQLIGVRVLADGYYRDVYFDSSEINNSKTKTAKSAQASDSGLSENPQFSVTIDKNTNTGASLSYSESHNQPGHYLFQKDGKSKPVMIGSEYPHIHNRLRSSLVVGSVVNEGLEIPYLLTLPYSMANIPSPLIVLPHGGPVGVFDTQYFDLISQFLSSQDYAVLRVNFRGSSGYSQHLKDAGKYQWGKLMISDIHKAMLEVASRADIDAEKVCAAGLSYGGYASAMLTINYPQHYRCAIFIAGVSDLPLLLNAPTRAGYEQADTWHKEHVGNVLTDYDTLKDISPVYLIDKLKSPMLILHGEKDLNVDVEHANRLRLMLDKYNKEYEFHIYPEAGHNFEEEGVMADVFGRIVEFVGRHIE